MRILILNYMETTAAGGINKVVQEIAKNLTRKDHEIIVLQANPFNLPSEEIYQGFKIIRVKSTIDKYLYGFSPAIYFYLKKHFNILKPDVVHIHGYHTLFSPEVIYIIKKIDPLIPIVFTPHYDPLNHSTIAGKNFSHLYDRIVGKKFLKLPDHIISVSDFEANNLRKIFSLPNGKITVIPHGVDYINTQKKVNTGYITLLYVGYLLEYKGVQYIIKALHELLYTFNIRNVVLRIIGEGQYKKELISISRKLRVYEFIEWIPFLHHDEVLREMKNADIFLLLSRTEGYGIVVAEALAHGTPCIVTMGTALEEFTKIPGCFGVNYPPDPKEVANLIIKIYESDIQVGPFSKRIRTWDEVAKDYEKVYNEISKR